MLAFGKRSTGERCWPTRRPSAAFYTNFYFYIETYINFYLYTFLYNPCNGVAGCQHSGKVLPESVARRASVLAPLLDNLAPHLESGSMRWPRGGEGAGFVERKVGR